MLERDGTRDSCSDDVIAGATKRFDAMSPEARTALDKNIIAWLPGAKAAATATESVPQSSIDAHVGGRARRNCRKHE